MDIAEFIGARLDEEEAEVKGPPGWKLEHWTAVRYGDDPSGRNWRVDAEPRCVIDSVIGEDAQYIARHDPARVLREIEAKRALVSHATKVLGYTSNVTAEGGGLIRMLKHTAAIWGDHPDYKPEWRPADGT